MIHLLLTALAVVAPVFSTVAPSTGTPAQGSATMAPVLIDSGLAQGAADFTRPTPQLTMSLVTSGLAPYGNATFDLNASGLVSMTITSPEGTPTIVSGVWRGTAAGGYLVARAIYGTPGPGMRFHTFELKWYANGTAVGGWRLYN